MKCLTIGLVVIAASLFSVSAEASTITILYLTGGGCSDSTGSSTSSATCSAGGMTTTVAADATLSLLRLSLDSSGTFPAGTPFASSTIRIEDTLTVIGGVGSGTLIWDWAFDGTLDAGDGFYSQVSMSNLGGGAFADYRACGDNVPFGGFICAFDGAPNPPGGLVPAQPHEVVNANRSISIPFVFGTPLNVDWRLFATIAHGCTFGNNCNNPVVGGGAVGFFNTLQLQPIVVLDGNGTQVGGASALSTSGFSYAVAPASPVPSPVPEPASLLLLGTGLAAVVRRRFKSRR